MLKSLINEISSVAGYLWEKGWAEKNAGNISFNLTDKVKIPETKIYSCKLERSYAGLSRDVILVTASGSRMRDIKDSPLKHIIFVAFDEKGSRFAKFKLNNKFSFFVTEDIPSSELPVHLRIHEVLKETGSSSKAVLHTHSTELISFSHLKECSGENKLNKNLSAMHNEFSLFIPDGVGLVKEQESGNEKIADETAEQFRKRRIVLWKKHGVIAAAESPANAFDIIDIASKSAKIFLMSKGKMV